MPCLDQPSHSHEQSTKRFALEDWRFVHIEENTNNSLATIGTALKIRGPFLESAVTLREIFECHNSLLSLKNGEDLSRETSQLFLFLLR